MKYEIHFAGELMMTCLHVTLFVFCLFCSFLMVMVVFNLKTFSTGEILFYLIVAKVRILIFANYCDKQECGERESMVIA
jgi:hypothetical protein